MMLRTPTTEAADRVELDALLGDALHPCSAADDGDDFGDLTTGELAAELAAVLLGSGNGEAPVSVVPAPAAELASEAGKLFDAHWRARARALTPAPAATITTDPARGRPRRDRPALVERLAVLRQRYPELAAAHRHLTDVSDELLAALVEDIEHVTGDHDDPPGHA